MGKSDRWQTSPSGALVGLKPDATSKWNMTLMFPSFKGYYAIFAWLPFARPVLSLALLLVSLRTCDQTGWKGATWGVAYELTGEAALHYLETREVSLGGYATNVVTFFPKDAAVNPFPVLLYIATPSSQEGDVLCCVVGVLRHNVEYLLRLAEFMREKVPEGYDEHLASLETLVRLRIKENNMCLKSLMGDGPREPHPQPAVAAAVLHQEPQPAEERRNTFQFSAKLPPKKLRCLNAVSYCQGRCKLCPTARGRTGCVLLPGAAQARLCPTARAAQAVSYCQGPHRLCPIARAAQAVSHRQAAQAVSYCQAAQAVSPIARYLEDELLKSKEGGMEGRILLTKVMLTLGYHRCHCSGCPQVSLLGVPTGVIARCPQEVIARGAHRCHCSKAHRCHCSRCPQVSLSVPTQVSLLGVPTGVTARGAHRCHCSGCPQVSLLGVPTGVTARGAHRCHCSGCPQVSLLGVPTGVTARGTH
ncbi:glutathione-specific gamma-glutamylcyclotransferase 2-like 3, partial [Homarus americanus]